MATAIAIIENLGREDCGFGWGSDRPHRLIVLGDTLCEEVRELIGDDAAATDVAAEVAETIRRKLGLRDEDVAVVDTEEGVTDEWPTAGSADSWADDVWLGLADYLSYRTWRKILDNGSGYGYTLMDEDAESCVRNSGVDAVSDALEYLDDTDDIYLILRRAISVVAA